jgi:hypothetical protein
MSIAAGQSESDDTPHALVVRASNQAYIGAPQPKNIGFRCVEITHRSFKERTVAEPFLGHSLAAAAACRAASMWHEMASARALSSGRGSFAYPDA